MRELIAIGLCLVMVSAIMAAMGFRGREQIVGIDLGTTFSVVAVKYKGQVLVLPDRSTGKQLVPSVVAYLPNNTVVVGDRATELRRHYPLHTIFNSKRFIGRTLGDATADAEAHPFRVVGNFSESNADAAATPLVFSIPGAAAGGDKWYSPIDVGAAIVSHLKSSVGEYMGYSISRAVICVPAKFTERQTADTQKAFEKAGFKVMRILDEPTAAAVAYNLHKATGVRHVLVYDIGGGTLDTSLLYMNGRSVSLLGIAGDDHLGGSDFDLRMRQLLEEKLPHSVISSLRSQSMKSCNSNGLYILGEEAKIRLSSEMSIEVQCLAEDGGTRAMVVTREEFENACKELFDRALAPVNAVLRDQMMSVDDIDDIVLVGGASRMPRLRAMLQQYFGPNKQLHTDIDPDVTVAYGAAHIID